MTLFQTLGNLDKRLTRIEQWLGMPAMSERKAKPVIRVKSKRRHANKAEGKQIRDNIVNLLISKKKLTPKKQIVKAIRGVRSESALTWYLQDLKKQGRIKMPKKGYYTAR